MALVHRRYPGKTCRAGAGRPSRQRRSARLRRSTPRRRSRARCWRPDGSRCAQRPAHTSSCTEERPGAARRTAGRATVRQRETRECSRQDSARPAPRRNRLELKRNARPMAAFDFRERGKTRGAWKYPLIDGTREVAGGRRRSRRSPRRLGRLLQSIDCEPVGAGNRHGGLVGALADRRGPGQDPQVFAIR